MLFRSERILARIREALTVPAPRPGAHGHDTDHGARPTTPSPAGRPVHLARAWLPPGGSTAGSSAPAAVGGLKRLIFINNGDDPFWHACNAGLLEGAKRYALESRGLRVVMETNNGTAQGQIEKLRQLASQPDVVGVAISVIQAENAAIEIGRAHV